MTDQLTTDLQLTDADSPVPCRSDSLGPHQRSRRPRAASLAANNSVIAYATALCGTHHGDMMPYYSGGKCLPSRHKEIQLGKEQNLSVRYNGSVQDLSYAVENGTITVRTPYGSRTTQLGDSKPQSAARTILFGLIREKTLKQARENTAAHVLPELLFPRSQTGVDSQTS